MATFKYKITSRYAAASKHTRVRYFRHLIRKEKEKLQRRKAVTNSRKVLNTPSTVSSGVYYYKVSSRIIYSFSYDDSFLNVFYVCESQFYDAFSSYHKAYTK
jgi:hypothetical protein